jgi:hypothetical protein
MLSSCPALWRAVDQKQLPFKYSRWEAWILTAVQALCFQFDSVGVDGRSPVKKLTALNKIAKKVNDQLTAVGGASGAESFYNFYAGRFEELFPPEDYSSKLEVLSSLNEARESMETKDIILVVGREPPSEGSHTIGRHTFDLDVVVVLKSKEQGRNAQAFQAVRYMRHPGHDCFWKQERDDAIATKCAAGANIFQELQQTYDSKCYFYSVVSVYVRRESDKVEIEWEKKFFESMGGKAHVICQCRRTPFIPTNHAPKNKLPCNFSHYIGADGVKVRHNECNRVESVTCSNPLCATRMCRKCYDKIPTNRTTIVIPRVESKVVDEQGDLMTGDESIAEERDYINEFDRLRSGAVVNDQSDLNPGDEPFAEDRMPMGVAEEVEIEDNDEGSMHISFDGKLLGNIGARYNAGSHR